MSAVPAWHLSLQLLFVSANLPSVKFRTDRIFVSDYFSSTAYVSPAWTSSFFPGVVVFVQFSTGILGFILIILAVNKLCFLNRLCVESPACGFWTCHNKNWLGLGPGGSVYIEDLQYSSQTSAYYCVLLRWCSLTLFFFPFKPVWGPTMSPSGLWTDPLYIQETINSPSLCWGAIRQTENRNWHMHC